MYPSVVDLLKAVAVILCLAAIVFLTPSCDPEVFLRMR